MCKGPFLLRKGSKRLAVLPQRFSPSFSRFCERAEVYLCKVSNRCCKLRITTYSRANSRYLLRFGSLGNGLIREAILMWPILTSSNSSQSVASTSIVVEVHKAHSRSMCARKQGKRCTTFCRSCRPLLRICAGHACEEPRLLRLSRGSHNSACHCNKIERPNQG
jgi:hypothetical protein